MADGTVTVTTESGLLESIKDKLNPSYLMKKLNLTSNKLMEMGIYLGVGFLAGYVLKKYGKFMIALMVFILGLLLLQQLGVISLVFHGDKLQELLGMNPVVASEQTILLTYWDWIKANVILVISFSIGFLIGLRSA